MRTHQKYFSLLADRDGAARRRASWSSPTYRTADGGTDDRRRQRARAPGPALATPASSGTRTARGRSRAACPSSTGVVFHAKLGTRRRQGRAPAERLRRLARACRTFPGRATLAERAALLAKADLVTGMVGEFPELQGVMGRYYAVHEGEHAASPKPSPSTTRRKDPNDACPTAPVSVAVALADKLDTPRRLLRDRREADRLQGSRSRCAARRSASSG